MKTTTKKTTTSKAKASSPKTKKKVGFEEIQKRAYEIYLERGCVEGFEQEDWKRAESELKSKAK